MMDPVNEEKLEKVIERFKEFDGYDVAELAAGMLVHHCVAAVVVAIAHNLLPTTTKKEKIQLYIAARAVSGLVADHATDRIEKKLDKVSKFVKETVRVIKNEKPSKDDSETAVPGSPETV